VAAAATLAKRTAAYLRSTPHGSHAISHWQSLNQIGFLSL
jgi:hypothetical protein